MCSVHIGRRGLVGGLLAVCLLAVSCTARQPAQPASPAPGPAALAQGVADAPVSIIEYGDYL